MRDCWICDAPITGTPNIYEAWPDNPWPEDRFYGGPALAHETCCEAWYRADTARLASLKAEACRAGHHRSPGRWTRDPADPYGDAQYWDCVKGCGHRATHPGYGIGRAIADLTRPGQMALFAGAAQ